MRGNIYKELRENYEFEKGERLTAKNLSDRFIKKGYSSLTHGAIRKLENGHRKLNINELIAYAMFFNVTVDYLLGIRENAVIDENVAMIGQTTGLCDEAILMLKKWSQQKSDLFIQKDLDTLNLILKECYQRNRKIKSEKPVQEYSILHLIGNYIRKQSFKIAPIDRITIQTDSDKYILIEKNKVPKILGEDKTISDYGNISQIYNDRSEDFGICFSEYTSRDCVPVIYNDNEEMGIIKLDESLIEINILNDIKNELDFLKNLKEL